ncbi:MAG: polysaccharide deacetylase family protein [Lewinella sp.]
MDKFVFLPVLFLLLTACVSDTEQRSGIATPEPVDAVVQAEATAPDGPIVSFSFDDGITKDILDYRFEEWNGMLLAALREADIKATFFVTGRNKLTDKGKYLLESWDSLNHQIANHTFTHPYLNAEDVSVEAFRLELIKTDAVINGYKGYTKLFRFPYLKEGGTEEKVSGFRGVLDEYGYQNGYVTIDASDWYINAEFIKAMRSHAEADSIVDQFRAFYIQHILERATFYEALGIRVTGRHIPHTLLLHHNLTSALFLPSLIEAFETIGWRVIDSPTALADTLYNQVPPAEFAGESLIYALAMEAGYGDELRYPAEDSRYEHPKMVEAGLIQ